jgi:hypothetical protein
LFLTGSFLHQTEDLKTITNVYKILKTFNDTFCVIECDKKYVENIGESMRLSDLYYNSGEFKEVIILQ